MDLSLEVLQQKLNNSSDVIYRKIYCQDELITIVGIENMIDGTKLSQYIIEPLLNYNKPISDVETLCRESILANPASEVSSIEEAFEHLSSGCVLLFFTSYTDVIYCNVAGFAKRPVDIPTSEATVKGPREGFSEDIQDNLSLIRRRLKTSDMKAEQFKLGKKSLTSCYMLYVEGVAPAEVVKYVREKIEDVAISRDYIFYSNNIEESLKAKGTAFDTVGYSEKPDICAQKISEGRITILVDGSSNAAIVPYFFNDSFQVTDDYTMNKYMANTARFLRFMSFWIATLAPGLYIALITHHFRLIPTILLFKLAMYRAVVPVPTIIELLIMIGFFQILREAAVRLPQPIGSTLSIIGALILGDAAVASGLASQITVVVVGITSICSYLVPKMYIAIFYWNTLITILSVLLGLPGFYTGFVMLIAHMADLNTVGYPYANPIATRSVLKYQDLIYRGTLNEIGNPIFFDEGSENE